MLENIRVFGIHDSIIASGYPMSTVVLYDEDFDDMDYEYYKNGLPKRAYALGQAKSGSGHDCYLKGITVQADLTCSQAMHMQILRYHFFDIVSSQSKMHRLIKMNLDEQCNEYVDYEVKDILKMMIRNYNLMLENDVDAEACKKQYLKIIYNCPMGLNLTFRFTTNYLQLKTIYKQRKNHRLPEWREFTSQILELPHFKELTGCGLEKEDKTNGKNK